MYLILSKLAPIGAVLQFLLLIHVYRTGRPFYWYWVLLALPLLGGAAYVLFEILPELNQGRGNSWFALLPRPWRLSLLRERVEECDTVENRERLAAELRAGGDHAEALEVLQNCLQGVFRDDAHVLYDAAMIHIDQGQFSEALALLERAQLTAEGPFKDAVRLARGHCEFGQGNLESADAILRPMEPTWSGEQVRYLLAMMDLRNGNIAEGTKRLEALVKNYRRSTHQWRMTEKPWFKLARAELARLKAEAAASAKKEGSQAAA